MSIKTDAVFGISPTIKEYSYIDRGNLDSTLNTRLQRSTHLAIRGPSKCGKSWLRQKVLSDSITVQCRFHKPYTEIYVDALSQLNINIKIKESTAGSLNASVSAKGEFGAGLLAKVGLSSKISAGTTSETEQEVVGHDINDLRYIADIIKASEKRLVIEDFHYMSTDARRLFAFDLKALWDYSVFVIIIGIWTETNLLLHLNPDLTGRVFEISIDWINDDLFKILSKGEEALNLSIDKKIKDELVALSYSNAGLLQTITLEMLDDSKIESKKWALQRVNNIEHVHNASMLYADQLNAVYQQFAKNVAAGIRKRQNSTGIYAHTMAVLMEASDDELIRGINARTIHQRAAVRQERIQYGNLKSILDKFQELQLDSDGRGLILGYSPATEEVTIVDRALLLYRRYATVKWPWEDIISEAEKSGGLLDAD